MKKVYIQGRYNDVDKIKLEAKNLTRLQWEVVDNSSDCDYFISFDSINIGNKKSNVNYILIRNEPKIILPECYNYKNEIKFNLIIEVGKPINSNLISVNHPQNLKMTENNDRFKDRVIIINSNLFSLRQGEQYSLRRRAIQKFDFIDLYGYGWNKSFFQKVKTLIIEIVHLFAYPSRLNLKGQLNYFVKFRKYKGEISNKNLVNSKYRYSLVIENSPTYISEKLFDAITSGCIPIYVGIDLDQFGIPTSLYVKAEPNLTSIQSAYERAKEIDYSDWDSKRRIWISSEEVKKKWSRDLFLFNIKKAIES